METARAIILAFQIYLIIKAIPILWGLITSLMQLIYYSIRYLIEKWQSKRNERRLFRTLESMVSDSKKSRLAMTKMISDVEKVQAEILDKVKV